MIRLEDVQISFANNAPLIRDVNLAVRRGETFVVIGASGSGKSVLLKTIAGLIKPTSGRVLIENHDLYHLSRKRQSILMQKMGMLFQKNALFDSLTVAENLAFPLREVGRISEAEIIQKVKIFLQAVELSGSENLFPDEVSGGMQKRVGIARALILNPEIILYDDPTAGLDPITSKIIIELIMRLNRELGTTVIAITNDMNRAYQLADRIGIIQDHQLLITGSVEETQKYANRQVQDFINGIFHEGDDEALSAPSVFSGPHVS